MYDTLITGADVLDGSGAPAAQADVAVEQGRIVAVGRLAGQQARRTVKADGLMLCPGFIDMHSHDDFNLPLNPQAAGKTEQGVTTQVVGNCGYSPAPVLPDRKDDLAAVSAFLDSGLDFGWTTFGEYLNRLPDMGVNVAHLVGHVSVRTAVMGVEERAPSAEELSNMQTLVAEAMQAGAFGFSTGLTYPPSSYADTEEIVALARIAGQHGGGYFTHMRNYAADIFNSVAEAIEIGRRGGCSVQISHLQITSRKDWGRVDEVMALIDEANTQGVKVHADHYPYIAGSGGMKSKLPGWVHVGGAPGLLGRLANAETRGRIRQELEAAFGGEAPPGARWQDVLIADSPSRPDLVGMRLHEAAAKEQVAPAEMVMRLVESDQLKTVATTFLQQEPDLRRFMQHPRMIVGSDGIFMGVPGAMVRGKPHPRHFGTFPRVIGHYGREEGILSLSQAVHKMTGLTAQAVGLKNRGWVRQGMAADLVLFDPTSILDTATFTEPYQRPLGVRSVWVNGQPTVEDGQHTGATPGHVLRRGAA